MLLYEESNGPSGSHKPAEHQKEINICMLRVVYLCELFVAVVSATT